MGVPGFYTDLEPYAEQVVVGDGGEGWPIESQINSLVIDGPSLVYFVFQRLLCYKQLMDFPPFHALPSDSEMVDTTVSFLVDLENHHVKIEKIYFDGGLPVSKRPVREQRLEKSRAHLEICRRAYPAGFQSYHGPPMEKHMISEAVWNRKRPPRKESMFPSPPFMVTNIVQGLQDSRWSEVLEMVPGESDMFCAASAKDCRAAILSSDSDMVLYDLDENIGLLLLQSLERSDTISSTTGTRITGLFLPAKSIAKHLKMSNLQDLAYERYLDASASFAVIKQRAHINGAKNLSSPQYWKFSSEFDLDDGRTCALPYMKSKTERGNDARISELIHQFQQKSYAPGNDENIHMYLPILFEDPSRDSSWNFGLEYRQLGYSLLNLKFMNKQNSEIVVEFRRSGNRICQSAITLLDEGKNVTAIAAMIQAVESSTRGLRKSIADAFALRQFALQEVGRQKIEQGKAGLRKDQRDLHFIWPPQAASISWESIHLEANLKAVEYSLRVVMQASLAYVSGDAPPILGLDRILQLLQSLLLPRPHQSKTVALAANKVHDITSQKDESSSKEMITNKTNIAGPDYEMARKQAKSSSSVESHATRALKRTRPTSSAGRKRKMEPGQGNPFNLLSKYTEY